jgi:hypothetical protein
VHSLIEYLSSFKAIYKKIQDELMFKIILVYITLDIHADIYYICLKAMMYEWSYFIELKKYSKIAKEYNDIVEKNRR